MEPDGSVAAALPEDEDARLEHLRALNILDTDPEGAFDDIVALAADLLDTPMAAISLIDEHRQWFKARVGIGDSETPREQAFCAHAILEPDAIFEVADAQEDERFATNPFVTGDPNVRFYAGAPLETSDGFALGTLCVIDSRPRTLDERSRRALRSLADQVATQLELRRVVRLLDEQVEEEHRTKEALTDAEARYRLLFQHSTDIISVWDADMNWRYASPAGPRILGYEPDVEFGGILKLIHPDDLPAVAEVFGDVVTHDWPVDQSFICQVRGKDGTYRLFESMAVNLLDEPSINGVVITSHDVTERLRDADRLAAALGQAEEASRLKSDFLAMMSHEIRTPLNGVLGMTGVLLGTDLDGDQREAAEVVRRSGESLLVVLNDLLDLSKIEAGRIELEIIDYDLGRIVDDVIGLSADAAKAKGVDLRSTVSPRVPPGLRGDPFRLRQVLTNLVSNAVKFTDTGSVDLTVDVIDGDSSMPRLRFAITDTGIGIEPDHVGRLFEPFAQAEASVTRRFGGTGLGLAICKRLVDLLEGVIGVDSAPGIGSTFWVLLPLTPAEVPVPPPASAPIGPAAATGRTVLIAEDNPVNQLVMVRLLGQLGYRVDVAADGSEAVGAVQRQHYDAVLMDLNMPVMDGCEASERMRANGADLPIIAMTASALDRDRDRCLEAGMDDVLIKPLRVEDVAGALEQWLGAAPPAPAPSIRPEEPAIGLVDAEAFEAIRALYEGDGMRELVASFGSDADVALQAIETALTEGDATKVEQLAHRVAGSSSTLGAVTLAEQLRRLEHGEAIDSRNELRSTLQATLAEFDHLLDHS